MIRRLEYGEFIEASYLVAKLLPPILIIGQQSKMPRVAVKSVADAGRKFPREFALLHQLGGTDKDVDSEVCQAGRCLKCCHRQCTAGVGCMLFPMSCIVRP